MQAHERAPPTHQLAAAHAAREGPAEVPAPARGHPTLPHAVSHAVTEGARKEPEEVVRTGRRREGVLSWQDFFMGVALLASRRSKDPRTRVGACIATPTNIIVGVGYNGMPNGCSDNDFPWTRPEKYAFVVHAELNAILNSGGRPLSGCTIFCTMFPCAACVKAIIQAGIRRVVFGDTRYRSDAATRMLAAAGVLVQALSDKSTTIHS